MVRKGRLVLEDGTQYEGTFFGANEPVAGEVVFNTGMVGYPESLTDPSYSGQILTLTYPLVGNYGVPEYSKDDSGLPAVFESDRIQAAGLIVWEHSECYSHYTATRSLDQWLASEGIPALAGIDTRALTKRLRSKGTMLGAIEPDGLTEPVSLYDPNATDLVAQVSVDEVVKYNGGGADAATVVVLDCGCKANIIRCLLDRGLNVIRVPHDHYFLGLKFDGLLISNGPGDPEMCRATITNIERALALDVPILGICLGNQLLALAAGAETYKLPFGHRSQNQPCVEVEPSGERSKRCVITSQNHGYAVRADSLPDDWRLWFVNANDGTVEGIRHISKPRWSVQFHPEATPGPVDSAWIFDDFVKEVVAHSPHQVSGRANGPEGRRS
jgi:carbamoyl-phosphate synthase small subunit